MTRKNFYLQVLILAVPIALQNLLTALLNIFDQMMVGWLPGGIADSGLSAVLLANQIVFIFQIVIFAICNTVNIFIAQYTENGNEHLIKNRAGFTFIIIAFVSIVFMLVCYLAPSFVIGLFNPSENYRKMAEDFLRLVALSFVPMGISVGIVFMLRAVKRLKAALAVNVCAVATLADCGAVVLCEGVTPDDALTEKVCSQDVNMLMTDYDAYTAATLTAGRFK